MGTWFETVDRFGANGMSSEGAFGWGGAYGSLYRVDPEARLVMALMIQLMPNATDVREVVPDAGVSGAPIDAGLHRDCRTKLRERSPLDDDSVSVEPVTTTSLSPPRIAV